MPRIVQVVIKLPDGYVAFGTQQRLHTPKRCFLCGEAIEISSLIRFGRSCDEQGREAEDELVDPCHVACIDKYPQITFLAGSQPEPEPQLQLEEREQEPYWVRVSDKEYHVMDGHNTVVARYSVLREAQGVCKYLNGIGVV